jgi:hypothetical protein
MAHRREDAENVSNEQKETKKTKMLAMEVTCCLESFPFVSFVAFCSIPLPQSGKSPDCFDFRGWAILTGNVTHCAKEPGDGGTDVAGTCELAA